MIWQYNKMPFHPARTPYTFHNVGQKISGAVDTAARVANTARKAYDVGITIYKLGTVIAPFQI